MKHTNISVAFIEAYRKQHPNQRLDATTLHCYHEAKRNGWKYLRVCDSQNPDGSCTGHSQKDKTP